MNLPRDVHPVLVRPWVAVAGGAVAGVVLATAVIVAWSFVGPGGDDPGRASSRPDTFVDVFRLPPGAAFEMLVAPAGPDASGEPALSTHLFPGEEPARELASVLVANTGALGDWRVSLVEPPLRAQFDGAGWLPLDAVADDAAAGLDASLRLRLRGLGGAAASDAVEPGTLRRFLLALPPGRTLSDASVVQWGERTLRRERMDIESLHAFRERPADVPPER